VSTRLVDQLHGVASVATPDTPYQQVKQRLHSELVAALDLQALQHLDQVEIDRQLRQTLTSMLQAQPQPLTREDQDRMVGDILDEVLGYGPIERLLHSPDVSDILINGPDKVYIERGGKLERVPVRFRDTAHLMHVINRIVGAVGRRVDESTPMVDARLPADGSRFNAVISPIALDGPLVSIRRFGVNPIRREDLLRLGSIPGPILELLEGMVKAKTNILVTRPSSGCSRITSPAWRPGRRTSKGKERSRRGRSSETRSGCARTGSSSGRSAATKPWTCSKR
jgi:pilus assembly protein CpaF